MTSKMSNEERVYKMDWQAIYHSLLLKVERKGRTQAELDAVITWLTGYDNPAAATGSVRDFYEQAPAFNPASRLIKGVICGVRVEEIENPLMKRIRQLDKLVDELAKGKTIEKILRKETV